MKCFTIVLLLLLIVNGPAAAQAKKINDYHWSGVERVVAIGDLHGDYDPFCLMLLHLQFESKLTPFLLF